MSTLRHTPSDPRSRVTRTVSDDCVAADGRPRSSWLLLPALTALTVLTALVVVAGQDEGRVTLDVVCGLLALVTVGAVLRLVVHGPRDLDLVLGAIVLAALAAMSPAATPASTATTLVVARTARLRIAVPVALAGTIGHALQGAWRVEGIGYGWWLLCDVGLHAALLGWGAYGRTRDQLVRSLGARARDAEADRDRRVEQARRDERLRIARDMHDTLAHRLSLLATAAGALAYRPDAPPERIAQAAAVVHDGVAEALDELRAVVGVLRDPDEVVPDLDDLVSAMRDAGSPVELTLTGDLDAASAPVRGTVLRTVQEALTNARKHAPGEPVDVVVLLDNDCVRVEATNPMPSSDGQVARAAQPGGALDRTAPSRAGRGVGLVGLRERVTTLGGRCDAGAADGTWTLRAEVPLHARAGTRA